ncbi:LacI family DNA-binding transcriptional regulator [Streptomyces sp. NPDC047002]|uniref:LacI family DNA-binding transcriptional regulator n=1 Tax=Streptomyces sp. NPDC047002 TaxID=3155475 RepID=UPI003453723B
MLTLRDIAGHVGVSISTVSLVLNDRDEGRVNADTAARIRRTASELGYVPNQLARSLKKGQTHTIGLVSDRVATVPFSGHMLAGAQQAAWDEGYLLLLIDTAGNDELQRPAVRSLLQRNIEALVFATTYHRLVDLPEVPRSVPVVVLDGRPSDPASRADFVVPDEAAGARAGVARLVAAGHRRIGFCTVPSYPVAARLRRQGYEEALRAAGLTLDPTLVVEAEDADTRAADAPAGRLLDRPDRPTAVFCFGDQIAMGFYQAARARGLDVPRDLSVVGFDNQEYVADALSPGLTTVQLPHGAMGAWAAHRALRRITGAAADEPPEGHLMPCPLVERDSVAPPRGGR